MIGLDRIREAAKKRFKRLVRTWVPTSKIKHPYPNQRLRVSYPRYEPYELILDVRICAGGAG